MEKEVSVVGPKPSIYRCHGPLKEGRFIARPNRFVVDAELEGRPVRAYLPNPGRLRELLYPGVPLLLRPSPGGATDWTVVAAERLGHPVLLHTHWNNDVAQALIEARLVPGLEEAVVERREVTEGRSRFDFLLGTSQGPMTLEVKSCTLFTPSVAMFPDAVTDRGSRHLRELADLAEGGRRSGVLFVVHSSRPGLFLPDYHTDLTFARTLLDVRDRVEVRALAVRWRDDLSLAPEVTPLEIPWETIAREARDRGSYLVLLAVDEPVTVSVSALGDVAFAPGWYVYVGSAMENLTARVERHRRRRKKLHGHIDSFRQKARFVAAFPVRSADHLECGLAREMAGLGGQVVPRFGSSDCSCPGHLFRFDSDPERDRAFVERLLHLRMERLAGPG